MSHCGIRRSCWRVALVVLLAGLLHAQSTTESIQGLVTDSSGAVVPGAKVTITNMATGVSRSVQTNETGNYSFPLVEVGNYAVRCEMQGFKTEATKNLRVETAAQVRQNFILQLGQVTETVEVSAAAVLLTTENSTVGGVIENKRIIELPLNGRNVGLRSDQQVKSRHSGGFTFMSCTPSPPDVGKSRGSRL